MADKLIREKDGKEEVWYSEEYFNETMRYNIEQAYRAGLNRGIRVEIHGWFDMNKPVENAHLDNFKQKFYDKLEEQFKEAFENGEVWRIKSDKRRLP